MRFCEKCGNKLENSVNFCNKCGFKNNIAKRTGWIKWLMIFLVAASLVTGLIIYSINYKSKTKNDNISVNSNNDDDKAKDLLMKSFNDFGDLIKVNLCKEAFDKYVTNASKENKGFDNFSAHCEYRSKDWTNFNILNVVISDDMKRADIRYSVDTTDKAMYDRCIRSSSTICSNINRDKPVKKEWVETWLWEDGIWKRDY